MTRTSDLDEHVIPLQLKKVKSNPPQNPKRARSLEALSPDSASPPSSAPIRPRGSAKPSLKLPLRVTCFQFARQLLCLFNETRRDLAGRHHVIQFESVLDGNSRHWALPELQIATSQLILGARWSEWAHHEIERKAIEEQLETLRRIELPPEVRQ